MSGITLEKSNAPGYIQPKLLKELWFHTGTVCNLRCSFCLEGSKPGDNRLNPITLADARPFIQEALALGVEQFSFTGGGLWHGQDARATLIKTPGNSPGSASEENRSYFFLSSLPALLLSALPHTLQAL